MEMLGSIRINPNTTTLIEAKYDSVDCAVVINGEVTQWFNGETRVRHNCLFSPILFSLLLEFVKADMKSLCKQLKLATSLNIDITYAHNTTLMSTMIEKVQLAAEELNAVFNK